MKRVELVHLPSELLQAFTRATLLRHARCSFRAMVDFSSSGQSGITVFDENIPVVKHLLLTLELVLIHGFTGNI